jgi:hypothetical protein
MTMVLNSGDGFHPCPVCSSIMTEISYPGCYRNILFTVTQISCFKTVAQFDRVGPDFWSGESKRWRICRSFCWNICGNNLAYRWLPCGRLNMLMFTAF